MPKYKVNSNVLGGHPGDLFESDDPWYEQFVPLGWLEEVKAGGNERSEPESGPGVGDGEGPDAGGDPGGERSEEVVSS